MLLSKTDSLFYSRTRKKKKCQLWGSVKTPTGDTMKWTDKRVKEYLNDGNEIMISANSEPNVVCWVQWVRLKMHSGSPQKSRYMLTTDIYDEFTKYDKRRVKAFLGDHTCFQYFYNKRLNAYEAERNALDNQNAPTNP